jgi:hypothetical protein
MGPELNIFCGRIQLTLSFGLLVALVTNVAALLWAWL